jgi:hypothetical protein
MALTDERKSFPERMKEALNFGKDLGIGKSDPELEELINKQIEFYDGWEKTAAVIGKQFERTKK